MAKDNDKKPMSVWFWLFVFFVTALPCINMVALVFWAYYAKNETFRNYCRAMILMIVLIFLFYVITFVVLGFAPEIMSQIGRWFSR